MDVSSMMPPLSRTLVNVQRGGNPYDAAGVLVQGANCPLVLSACHCFQGQAVTGKRFSAMLGEPEEMLDLDVLDFNVDHDLIVFKVQTMLQNRETAALDFDPQGSVVGKHYMMFGVSSCDHVDSSGFWHIGWSMAVGYISRGLSSQYVIKGDSGCLHRDSGGPVFSTFSKRLIGILLSVSKQHPAIPDHEAARLRVSPECSISPTWLLPFIFGKDVFVEGGSPCIYSPAPPNINAGIRASELALVSPAPANMFFCDAGATKPLKSLNALIEELNKALDPYAEVSEPVAMSKAPAMSIKDMVEELNTNLNPYN